MMGLAFLVEVGHVQAWHASSLQKYAHLDCSVCATRLRLQEILVEVSAVT
jgi:hypothetical protein